MLSSQSVRHLETAGNCWCCHRGVRCCTFRAACSTLFGSLLKIFTPHNLPSFPHPKPPSVVPPVAPTQAWTQECSGQTVRPSLPGPPGSWVVSQDLEQGRPSDIPPCRANSCATCLAGLPHLRLVLRDIRSSEHRKKTDACMRFHPHQKCVHVRVTTV